MQRSPVEERSFLDMPVLSLCKLDLEKTLYMVLLVAALLTRFWDLGARSMSHDESLHALYSYKLYAGEGYRHDPMMHGPFQFHFVALTYLLFGDNDYTARVLAATFGVALVMLPYFFRRWLGRAGAFITATMLLISPSLLYYSRYIRNDILICVWAMLMILALFRYIETREQRWLAVGAAALSFSFATKEVTYITGFIGLTFIALAVFWESLTDKQVRALTYTGLVAAAIFALLAGAIQAGLLGGSTAVTAEGKTVTNGPQQFVQYLVLAIGLIVAALLSGPLLSRRHQAITEALRAISWQGLLLSILVAAIIYVLLYTTFFTNPAGLYTGSVGALSYWLEQHGVQRGGQPWYYYMILIPLYEFLPLTLSLIAIVYYTYRGASAPPDIQTPPRTAARAEDVKKPSLQIPPGTMARTPEIPFIPFVIYWLVATFLLYSWAGEKMPWLNVHVALPMIVLAGRFTGDMVAGANWRSIWRQGGGWLALLLPPLLFAIGVLVSRAGIALPTILRVSSGEGPSLQKLDVAGSWLSALLGGAVLAILAWRFARRLGGRASAQVAFAVGVILLALLTVRFAWLFSYINYDYVNEFLVYAHGTPDVKLAMREIEEISRRTVGDKQIKVAYDNDSTWPLEWYFREYPNRSYYADTPNRQALDAPVVIAGPANESKVKPYLGDRYYRFDYRLVWWPIEDYKEWTVGKIWESLKNPDERQKVWNIIFYRKYDRPFTEWPFVHRFAMYVRKDVANQLWNYSTGPVAPPPAPADPYAQGYRELASTMVIGAAGSGDGHFADPRGVALDNDGYIYVTDAGHHRIQVFNPDGSFLRGWGAQGSAPGQFMEPWGIAIGPDGNVYVADTWNHRIQVFDSKGTYLRAWGEFANTGGTATGLEGKFWGPRSIVFDASGNLYVSDTGNKRIQKFDREGNFLGQWGGYGLGQGQFDEPVGLAIDSMGNIYVADTWNRRIQKFSAVFAFVKEWPVHGWQSESVVNKPYMAMDGRDRLYVTDPEGYRVLVFDKDGNFLVTFGQYGTEATSLALPVGITVDKTGAIYVVDSANNRVMKFAPLP